MMPSHLALLVRPIRLLCLIGCCLFSSFLISLWLNFPKAYADLGPEPVPIGTDLMNAQAVAWGDFDNDGDLDLAVGTNGADRIYENVGGKLNPTPIQVFDDDPQNSDTRSIAWGDWNNDGNLDLAVGNFNGFTRVYQNEKGKLRLRIDPNNPSQNLGWQSPIAHTTTSIAWSDFNNDGNLDLAVGNQGQSNQVYENKGGTLQIVLNPNDPTQNIGWQSPITRTTASVAWGDFDKNGYLDLAIGNRGQSNLVYKNLNGRLDLTPSWSSHQPHDTRSVAWGDRDGDGYPELAVGNAGAGEVNQVYQNLKGLLLPDPSWESDDTRRTRSVAWGDWDSDGDLDLAAGNDEADSNVVIYKKENGTLLTTPLTISSGAEQNTRGLAWGDWNGDGDLDLAVVHDASISQVYENNSGASLQLNQTTPNLNCQPPNPSNTQSVAWGDWNGDGYLDIAVGNSKASSCIYTFNKASLLDSTAPKFIIGPPFGEPQDDTQSIAWGDFDSDGDLDLAVGNYGGLNYVYENADSRLLEGPDPIDPNFVRGWHSTEPKNTTSVAWGDFNNDGNLDLAVGNDRQANQIYENNGEKLLEGQDPIDPNKIWGWHAPQPQQTTSVAWGDFDNDGDLDLAIGNSGNDVNQVYENVGGTFALDPNNPTKPVGWQSHDAKGTTSIAWADYDQDGDLDLAVGNQLNVNQLYKNVDGHLQTIPSWVSTDVQNTQSIAWGDFDNDGDLDLAVGNGPLLDQLQITKIQIYANNHGELLQRPIWKLASPNRDTRSIAWGDFDGDGDQDLVIGNDNTQVSQVFENALPNSTNLPASALSAIIQRPFTKNAFFYSASKNLEVTDALPITYTLYGPKSNWASYVQGYYSLDGGGRWITATAMSPTDMVHLKASPAPTGTTNLYTWDTFDPVTGFFGQSDNVVFRLDIKGAAGPFQRAKTITYSPPFRLRGTQVQVYKENIGGEAAIGASVYRKKAGENLFTVMGNATSSFSTDLNGYLRGHGELGHGSKLLATLPITATQKYTVYYTNITPTVNGLEAFTVTVPGVQKLAISKYKPLILFNLTVSLEWDATNDPLYKDQLKVDLQRTSEFLFDLTNGQGALGSITIYQNRDHWEDADIHIYATNRLRPHATVGGIVPSLSAYTFTKTLENGVITHTTMIYERGHVNMGPIWNRYGNVGETYSEDWPRTLAHELGHYLFRLLDNYVGLDANARLKRVENCPGVMSNPYFIQESEFHPKQNWKTEKSPCKETLSNQLMGQDDWSILRTFFPLNEPDETVSIELQNQGPTSLPLAVTQVHFADVLSGVKPLVDTQNFTLLRDDRSTYRASNGARAFLFQNNFTQFVDLGAPRQNLVRSRGARDGDELCIYEFSVRDESGNLRAYTGCTTITLNNEELTMLPLAGWEPDVLIQPTDTYTLNVQVRNVPDHLDLVARVYPVDALTSTVSAKEYPLQSADTGGYSGTLSLPQPVIDAYLHIYVRGDRRQGLMTEYTLGGAPTLRLSEGDVVTVTGSTQRISEGDILRIGVHGTVVFQGGGHTLRLSEGDALRFAGDGGTLRISEGDSLLLPDGTTLRISEGDTLRMSEGDAPIRSSDGQVQLFSTKLNFGASDFYTIQPATTLPTRPGYATQIGQAYRITASPNAPTMNDTSISMYYFGRDIESKNEELLRIYFWDEKNSPETGKWQQLKTEIDPEHNYVIAQAKGFGIYVLMYSINNVLYGGQWNLVAYPLQQSMPITQATSSLLPYNPIFYGYDITKPIFERWQLYSMKVPSWANTLSALQPYQGYWINITNTLTATWQLQDITAATVGPLTPPATYYGVIQPVTGIFTPQAGMTIYAWVDGILCGVGQTQVQDNEIVYALAVYGDGPDELTGCGASGRQVHFAIASTNGIRLIETETNWSNQQPWALSLVPVQNQTELYLPIIGANTSYSTQANASPAPELGATISSNNTYLPLIIGNREENEQ